MERAVTSPDKKRKASLLTPWRNQHTKSVFYRRTNGDL